MGLNRSTLYEKEISNHRHCRGGDDRHGCFRPPLRHPTIRMVSFYLLFYRAHRDRFPRAHSLFTDPLDWWMRKNGSLVLRSTILANGILDRFFRGRDRAAFKLCRLSRARIAICSHSYPRRFAAVRTCFVLDHDHRSYFQKRGKGCGPGVGGRNPHFLHHSFYFYLRASLSGVYDDAPDKP